jgi:radical SAM superfamily enzyme YgiQ (UPF0313 family)
MAQSAYDLDAVLIHPGGRKGIYQSLASSLAAIESPIWAGMLATFLLRRGLRVAVLDTNADDLDPEDTARRVAEMRPRLAAVVAYGHNPSASTLAMPSAGTICRAIRQLEPERKVLLVGGHVAALPEQTLREEVADFVCGGEGPYTLSDLIEALRAGETDLSKVRGLWYRDEGQIRSTPAAPLVTRLDDEMPGLAWDLLPMEKYRAHNWHCFGHLDRRQPYASIYTTLGCPYHCSYCCIQAPFKSGEQALGYKERVNTYRFWSPDSVIAQIETLVEKYGVYNLKVADEMFVLNVNHVGRICDLILERGYKVNIWAYARVDTIRNAALVDKMKQAGVNWLCFGIESASERVRDDVEKGFRQDDIARSLNQVRQAGINVIGNYMFGLPEDDLETMQATLDLSLDLNCEFANYYCAMAYPGSQLYRTAVKEGWPLPKTWSGYSQHAASTLPLPTRHISGAEVLRFRDEAFQHYFHSPRYLDMIRAKFGQATVDHVLEMAAFPLVRDHVPKTSG